MFCSNCGRQTSADDRFCQFCGKETNATAPTKASISPGPARSSTTKTRGRTLKLVGFACACLLLLYVVIRILTPRSQETQTPQEEQASEVRPTPAPEEPIDPKVRKTTEKLMRETYAAETQKDLWRQGIEMTFQARDTTLYVRYILAGDAFKFQFQEQFVQQNAEKLKALGFTRIELTNGDTVWSWSLKNN
jgi:hypothetical protein